MPDVRREIGSWESGSAAKLASGEEIAPHRNEARTILVIDDDATIRTLLKIHLANAGYEVFAAEDAIEGGHLVH